MVPELTFAKNIEKRIEWQDVKVTLVGIGDPESFLLLAVPQSGDRKEAQHGDHLFGFTAIGSFLRFFTFANTFAFLSSPFLSNHSIDWLRISKKRLHLGRRRELQNILSRLLYDTPLISQNHQTTIRLPNITAFNNGSNTTTPA